MIHFSTILRGVVLLMAAVPLVYYMVASWAGLRFCSRKSLPIPHLEPPPPVSVLKPLRGIDFGSYENFASFCQQNYPEYEILFAVNDRDDPAVPLIERLASEHPEREIRLFIGAEAIGTNRKVNKLARLVQEAKHDILALSDGDVRVGPQYLRQVTAALADEKIGAVTSFYRGIVQRNLGAELEAIGASSDFFPGVLMAELTEGIHFALGASIATTKIWLARMGGFASIASALADDYELGHRIAQAGGQVVLSRETVWTMYPEQTAKGFWDHQVRWARTVRLCRPLSYVGLLFTQGLPWAFLAAIVAPARWIGTVYLLAYLILRLMMAWIVGVRGVGDQVLRRKWWLIPFRDAIHFVVWLASFASNRIIWAGRSYMIREGQMVPVPGSGQKEAKPAAHISH